MTPATKRLSSITGCSTVTPRRDDVICALGRSDCSASTYHQHRVLIRSLRLLMARTLEFDPPKTRKVS